MNFCWCLCIKVQNKGTFLKVFASNAPDVFICYIFCFLLLLEIYLIYTVFNHSFGLFLILNLFDLCVNSVLIVWPITRHYNAGGVRWCLVQLCDVNILSTENWCKTCMKQWVKDPNCKLIKAYRRGSSPWSWCYNFFLFYHFLFLIVWSDTIMFLKNMKKSFCVKKTWKLRCLSWLLAPDSTRHCLEIPSYSCARELDGKMIHLSTLHIMHDQK